MKIEYKNPLIGYVDLSSLNMKEIFELTGADYERKGNFIPIENIDILIEDLIYVIHKKQEEIDEYKQLYENDYDPEIEIPEIGERA